MKTELHKEVCRASDFRLMNNEYCGSDPGASDQTAHTAVQGRGAVAHNPVYHPGFGAVECTGRMVFLKMYWIREVWIQFPGYVRGFLYEPGQIPSFACAPVFHL